MHLAVLELGTWILFLCLNFATGGSHGSRVASIHGFALMIEMVLVVVDHAICVSFTAEVLVVSTMLPIL